MSELVVGEAEDREGMPGLYHDPGEGGREGGREGGYIVEFSRHRVLKIVQSLVALTLVL